MTLSSYIQSEHKDVLEKIRNEGVLSKDLEAKLRIRLRDPHQSFHRLDAKEIIKKKRIVSIKTLYYFCKASVAVSNTLHLFLNTWSVRSRTISSTVRSLATMRRCKGQGSERV